MTRVREQPYGGETIVKVLVHPDGPTFYRPVGPDSFSAVDGWYTAPKEALVAGLAEWQFDLSRFKRSCGGKNRAESMELRFQVALAELAKTGKEGA